MTTDLWMLVLSGVLSLVLPMIYVGGLLQTPEGVAWGFGNRETPIDMTGWSARAKRAHANLIENLPAFAILVLAAHVSGAANEATALGATIFFWARVAHALIYVAGITYARTAAYATAIAGEVMILAQLL